MSIEWSRKMVEQVKSDISVKGLVTIVVAIITTLGSVAAVVEARFSKAEATFNRRFDDHIQYPHKEAVSRNEFDMLREDIRELKALLMKGR